MTSYSNIQGKSSVIFSLVYLRLSLRAFLGEAISLSAFPIDHLRDCFTRKDNQRRAAATSQIFKQIPPLWIHPVDQIQLLLPGTGLDRFFHEDGRVDIVSQFKINQLVNLIFPGKFAPFPFFVLAHPALEIVGDPGVEYIVTFVGQYVDAVFFFHGGMPLKEAIGSSEYYCIPEDDQSVMLIVRLLRLRRLAMTTAEKPKRPVIPHSSILLFSTFCKCAIVDPSYFSPVWMIPGLGQRRAT